MMVYRQLTTLGKLLLRFRSFLPSALLVLAMLTAGCHKPTRLNNSVSGGKTNTQLPGVPNFSKVCNGLYRGGQPTDAGYQVLKDMGIRTIVTLRVFDRDSRELTNAGFRTYHISFKHIHPETEDVLKFLSIATDIKNRPVFVHCREGVDRTGMMIAIYRMVVQDWSKNQAIDEMKRMGFNDWNVAIERYLMKVDIKKLKRELVRYVANNRPANHERIQS